MADNPFLDQLNQLDGVVFDVNDLARADGPDAYVVGGANIAVADIYRDVSDTNQYFFDPGTLNVVSSAYLAGETVDGIYNPPVFGVISFSKIFFYDARNYVLTDKPIEFSIRGFSEEGLLLSQIGEPGGPPQAYNVDDLNGGVLVLSDDGFGPGSFNFPVTFGYDPTVYTVPPVCFAEGTRIATPSGAVAVESLAEGDLVQTAAGAARPVKWIGRLNARPARHPRPWEVNPVRVKAGAFAPGVPERDLLLSPGHSVHVDGMLVPVGQLVNGATILQEEVESIRYFHLELESHDVVLAEGLPCETYLDDGNRASFANAGEHVALHGRIDPANWDAACAPMVAEGPQVDAVQARLAERAEALGWEKSTDAALYIVADDCEIAPFEIDGDRYRFAVPAASRIVLRSTCGVLAQLRPERGDRRRLGVAVAALSIDGAAVELDDVAFGSGFHPIERDGDQVWRWTSGEATLTLDGAATVEVRIAMVAPHWRRAAVELRVAA